MAVAATGALALGGLAIAGTVSSAAFSDEANLNLGSGGVGAAERFDIGVVRPDGKVEQADLPSGFDWPVTDATKLVPGRSITTEVPVFNNTPRLLADTVVSVRLRNGDGTVAPGIPNITPYLRFSASLGGTALFSDATWDSANGAMGKLAARGAAPLAQGEAYAPGAGGSARTLKLTITYIDAPGVEHLNGGQAALALQFSAESARS